jgi:hypothetical protein
VVRYVHGYRRNGGDVTERESDAIRAAMNIMRTDLQTVCAVRTAMLAQGFDEVETQAAVNAVAGALVAKFVK